MNIINTQKSKEKLEINDEDLSNFYESKKNFLSPKFKITKSILKNILLDNSDNEWVIDYCKMITSKKVNIKAYLLSYIFVFLYLFVPLLSLSLMIYLWVIRDNFYWWILIIFVIICIPLHIFQGWIFSNKKVLQNKKNKRSSSIGAVIISSNYWNCVDLMTFGFNDKSKNKLKKEIIENCFNNVYQFIDDETFKKLKSKNNIKFTKRKYWIGSFFILIFNFFVIIISLWVAISIVPASIYIKQMLAPS